MNVIICVLVVWFYGAGQMPLTKVVQAPSMEACLNSIAPVKAHFLNLADVRDVSLKCYEYPAGDKA